MDDDQVGDTNWEAGARAAVAELSRIAGSVGRYDMVAALESAMAYAGDAKATVAVVGGYQHGKTSLISALLGVALAPSGPGGSTPASLVACYGDRVVISASAGAGPCDIEDVPTLVRTAWRTDPFGPAVVVMLPSPLLAEGLILVDTPGAPGFGGASVSAAMASLPIADAIVLVVSATQPMTASEIELAVTIARSDRPLLIVATKADLQVDWNRIVQTNRDALSQHGADVPVIAVSAPLRMAAMAAGDDDLDGESQVDLVVDWLLDDVLSELTHHRRRRITTESHEVLASLHEVASAERTALGAGPNDERVAALEQQARDIQTGASRWSQELNDLMTDLRGHVDADLRQRAQTMLREAEKRLADGDPIDTWEAYQGWLQEQLAASMTEHLTWRHERLVDVVERSAASFGELVALARPAEAKGPTLDDAKLAALPKKTSLGSSLYAVMRNSYGGVMMFGFLGGVAGVVLSAPITVGIGLALGTKSYREERAKQLTARRAQATGATKSYLEGAWGAFGNDAREQLKLMQRQVRDELTTSVERLRTDTRVAYESAKSAAAGDRQHVAARKAALEELAAALDGVASRLAALGGLVGSAA